MAGTIYESLWVAPKSMGGTNVAPGWHKRRTKRQVDGTIYAVDGNIYGCEVLTTDCRFMAGTKSTIYARWMAPFTRDGWHHLRMRRYFIEVRVFS
jgi:hypothetical protein